MQSIDNMSEVATAIVEGNQNDQKKLASIHSHHASSLELLEQILSSCRSHTDLEDYQYPSLNAASTTQDEKVFYRMVKYVLMDFTSKGFRATSPNVVFTLPIYLNQNNTEAAEFGLFIGLSTESSSSSSSTASIAAAATNRRPYSDNSNTGTKIKIIKSQKTIGFDTSLVSRVVPLSTPKISRVDREKLSNIYIFKMQSNHNMSQEELSVVQKHQDDQRKLESLVCNHGRSLDILKQALSSCRTHLDLDEYKFPALDHVNTLQQQNFYSTLKHRRAATSTKKQPNGRKGI
ncbi:hypothetical protein BDA99DRAFT_609200 [Phascolomyces articulosus]|uniref:Uncharacterized protein n=1 Tax=Phascolomyces articulosus TaxID=60185 RepID=A0AAD5P8D2_9FUNG|nr:hypothetical protein BDA99DRAFT_609200 [Phascolomyces articulosus]